MAHDGTSNVCFSSLTLSTNCIKHSHWLTQGSQLHHKVHLKFPHGPCSPANREGRGVLGVGEFIVSPTLSLPRRRHSPSHHWWPKLTLVPHDVLEFMTSSARYRVVLRLHSRCHRSPCLSSARNWPTMAASPAQQCRDSSWRERPTSVFLWHKEAADARCGKPSALQTVVCTGELTGKLVEKRDFSVCALLECRGSFLECRALPWPCPVLS